MWIMMDVRTFVSQIIAGNCNNVDLYSRKTQFEFIYTILEEYLLIFSRAKIIICLTK